jgi:hypothetical protein
MACTPCLSCCEYYLLLVLPQKYWLLKWAHLFTMPACLVSLPAWFVAATSTLVLLKLIFFKLICLEQSSSLRYLWLAITKFAFI